MKDEGTYDTQQYIRQEAKRKVSVSFATQEQLKIYCCGRRQRPNGLGKYGRLNKHVRAGVVLGTFSDGGTQVL